MCYGVVGIGRIGGKCGCGQHPHRQSGLTLPNNALYRINAGPAQRFLV